jgi:hypothetical protein
MKRSHFMFRVASATMARATLEHIAEGVQMVDRLIKACHPELTHSAKVTARYLWVQWGTPSSQRRVMR